jgi:transposase
MREDVLCPKADIHRADSAIRDDQLAANYLAFIKLASIRIWLRAYESVPWS